MGAVITRTFKRMLAILTLMPLLCYAELPMPPNLVGLSSKRGIDLLMGSGDTSKYFALAEHFTTQVNAAFCGPASLSTVLNALGVPRPMQPPSTNLNASEYNYFDQGNVFSPETEAVITQATVSRQGMTLDELSSFLQAHINVVAVAQHCSTPNTSLDGFRSTVTASLRKDGEFMIVNFKRSGLEEMGGGHHSPIAAYNKDADMLLVLDVSRYKYPAWWATVSDLYTAACTPDANTGEVRGLVFVSASPGSAATTANTVDSQVIVAHTSPSATVQRNNIALAVVLSLAMGAAIGALVTFFSMAHFRHAHRTVIPPQHGKGSDDYDTGSDDCEKGGGEGRSFIPSLTSPSYPHAVQLS